MLRVKARPGLTRKNFASSYLEHLNFLAAITVGKTKIPDVDLQSGFNALAIGVATQLSIDRDKFVTNYEVFS